MLESDNAQDCRAWWRDSGPSLSGDHLRATSTRIQTGQVTVLAHPRKSAQVQARCHACMLYAIAGGRAPRRHRLQLG